MGKRKEFCFKKIFSLLCRFLIFSLLLTISAKEKGKRSFHFFSLPDVIPQSEFREKAIYKMCNDD
jgi:hypothetical protein